MRAGLKFLAAVVLSMTSVVAQNCDDLTVVMKSSKSTSVKQGSKSYQLGLAFTNKDASSVTISKMSVGIPLGAYFQGAKPTAYRSLSRGSKSKNIFLGNNAYKDAFHSCSFANWTDITLPSFTTMQYRMSFHIDYCADGPLIFTGTIQYGANCTKALTPIEVRLVKIQRFLFSGKEAALSSPRVPTHTCV
jgi:hypothetical protein